ncbi:hypothetical protein ACFVMC_14985 [Nocardia sp. NPDC127579]|uniref:hypothetical protein n=1 Tax=Nocardia sp. NPDC127579 TaxID=3345402 RepID=UPI00363B150B
MPRSAVFPVEYPPVPAGLPTYRDMARAFHCRAGRAPGAHLVLIMAAALAALHRVQPGSPCEISALRHEFATRIDRWIAVNLPGRPGWSGPPRSPGGLADEMAAAQIAADRQCVAGAPVDAYRLRATQLRLGALAIAWTDLIAEISAAQPYPAAGEGRRRYPLR